MNLREQFAFSTDEIHLNNAGTAPLTKAANAQVYRISRKFLEHGAHAIPELIAENDKCREVFGKLVGTIGARVAFTPNLATGISLTAWGLPLKKGDGILTVDQEYPSNACVWIDVARKKELKLHTFASEADTSINWDGFIEAIQPGVRVVALSWVQYRTGVTAPLEEISAACKRVGAWFVVDAIQGAGVLPFDLQKTGVDIVCCGSHKWLCSFTGHGFMAFKDDLYLQMDPLLQGAMTYSHTDDTIRPGKGPLTQACRFEPGASAHLLTIAAAASAQTLMDAGVDQVAAKAMSLANLLIEELVGNGFTVLGDPLAKRKSPIVTFRGKTDSQVLHEALTKRKVSHAHRLQSIRISPHAFNTEDEIREVISIVKSAKKN
jgi:selenocysteine lyase/cysteine desulfurase